MRKERRLLLLSDRRKIAEMYLAGARIADIAREIGVQRGTIYKELDRGRTGKMDVNGRPGYDPELGQKTAFSRWKSWKLRDNQSLDSFLDNFQYGDKK